MKTDIESLYAEDPVRGCRLALARTRNVERSERLDAINELLGGHGTEAIRGEWQNGYWCDIAAAYVNMGDTYALTVLEIRPETSLGSSRFIVSSWGDYVDRMERKSASCGQ